MEDLFQSHIFLTVMATVTAFLVTYLAIPSIIQVAEQKHLFDEPNERKSHSSKIPTLGGVAIFGGFIISLAIWSDMRELKLLQYVLAAACLIFLVGAKDDIVDLSAKKKFIVQIIATCILLFFADLRFTSFHDMFPGLEVPYIIGLIVTGFTILVITNAFNLIDGINALSGSQGILIATTFGVWFWLNGDYQMVILVAALVGAILAFLRYNVSPASIFMGDTGSLLVGLLSAVMAICFAEANINTNSPVHIQAAPAVAIGILAHPLFDLLRAFSIRIAGGRSPFSPDRNHLHHMLLDCGLSHMKATGILAVMQVGYIVLVFVLNHFNMNSWIIIGILLLVSVLNSFIIGNRKKVFQEKQKAL